MCWTCPHSRNVTCPRRTTHTAGFATIHCSSSAGSAQMRVVEGTPPTMRKCCWRAPMQREKLNGERAHHVRPRAHADRAILPCQVVTPYAARAREVGARKWPRATAASAAQCGHDVQHALAVRVHHLPQTDGRAPHQRSCKSMDSPWSAAGDSSMIPRGTPLASSSHKACGSGRGATGS